MANMKLTLGRLPDFKLPVDFVLPNGDEQRVVFTVKHMKSTEIQELYEAQDPTKDHEFILQLATNWDVVDEFNEENVKELVDLFPGAVIALMGAYMRALAGIRVKN